MSGCASGHAIVLASAEVNSHSWLDGRYFELRSRKPWLQEAVGDGGTLWIVVSRPLAAGGRLYTVSFRLEACRSRDYAHAGKFGRHAVIGDETKSRFFAAPDARLLLLSLRFEPFKPINGHADNQVSNSLRRPRCLSKEDVDLLERYVSGADRWGAFVGYRRSCSLAQARELSDALQLAGVAVFRDLESLKGGDIWWDRIQHAIARSQRFILIVGPTTHESKWTRQEVRHALKSETRIIPVLAGGDLGEWGDLRGELERLHSLNLGDGVDAVVDGLAKAHL